MSMTLIATSTVGAGGAASIEFTGIPQDGTDLLLVFSLRSAGNDFNLNLTLNNDSSAIYNERRLRGTGSAVASLSTSNGTVLTTQSVVPNTYTASTFSNGSIYLPNYSGAASKSFSMDSVTENNASTSYQTIQAGNYNSTSAITQIKLQNNSNLDQFSSASLYKITKA